MPNKQEILRIFQKNPEKYWKVELFEREGFKRKICSKCGTGFWTLDENRQHCPNPNCGEKYEFVGKPITKKKFDYIEMWKAFEKFFVDNGHTLIPRYPVVAKWRDDIFFNIASIVDFQRFDNGIMTFDYPANPLIVPQVCMRFNDIRNVGVTGRHYTTFIMPGQHSFNYPREGYWKDRTIDLNFEFFTKVMGIPKENLIYVEELWTMPDFSALGPYLETYSLGLEMVNSGFMEFGWNGKLIKLPMKVIDVGWGLERLAWFSNGTPTSYDVTFGNVNEKFKKAIGIEYDKDLFLRYSKICGNLDLNEVDIKTERKKIASLLNISVDELNKKILPLEAMYAILDHMRSVVFAVSDGVLPSNVGAGHFIRIVLRRSLGFVRKFDWDVDLKDVAIWHVDYLKKMFPELEEHKDEILTIIDVEEKKYNKSKENIKRIVETLKNKKIVEDDLIKIYETYGITPEDLGIEVPITFYKKLEKKPTVKKKENFSIDVTDIPATKILFYDNVFEFKAKVIKVVDDWVVLDKTAFYPRSGGQDHDNGTIGNAKVLDVIKVGDVILHKVNEKLNVGEVVKCKVDEKRRKILTQHHDAIHVVNGLVKKIIGSWCNQYGAEKTVEKARIDITHFENLNEEQTERIEEEANKIIQSSIPIKKFFMNRMEAEKKFGFRIYQGGYVPSKKIRIVEIPGVDVEACSGTHGDNTKEIGYIKIIRTKRIADGLVRIELVAGERAIRFLKERERILKEVCEKLGVEEEKIVEAVENLFNEWKRLRKILRKQKRG